MSKPPLHRGAPDKAAAEVLRAAHGLLKRHGWQPHWLPETERHAAVKVGNRRARALSLASAIQQAGNGSIDSFHARQVLQRLVGPVPAWEQHPLRIWSDVEQLLARAVTLAGDVPRGRGNWTVSSGPWKKKGGAR